MNNESILVKIENVLERMPEVLKKYVAYISLSGSFILDLHGDSSDYDVSVVLDPDLKDMEIISLIQRYIKVELKNLLPSDNNRMIDVHSIRSVEQGMINRTIAIMMMKYQYEKANDLTVYAGNTELVEKCVNYYFNNISYSDLLSEYYDNNSKILEDIALGKNEYIGVNALFYHFFLMLNIITYGELYPFSDSKKKIERIKKIIKTPIVSSNTENNLSENIEVINLEDVIDDLNELIIPDIVEFLEKMKE